MGQREKILGAQDLKRKTVPVPEWEEDVVVRSLTYPERAVYFREAMRWQAIREAAKEQLEEKPAEGDISEPAAGPSDPVASLSDPQGPPEAKAAEPETSEPETEIYDYYRSKGRVAATAVCLAAIDPASGDRLFDDNDVGCLEGKSPEVLDRLHSEIAMLSGIGPKAEVAIEKNSERTLSAAPSSSSASPSGEPPASSSGD